jgi:hypothetical protein
MGCVGSSFSMDGDGSIITCSGILIDEIGCPLVNVRSFLGVSPRSILDVLNLTLPDGDRGGVMILSSGSSGIRDEMIGSDSGAAEDVSLSPDSDIISSVVFVLRRLTTRCFFLRLAYERDRPAPSDRPVVVVRLTSEGLDGRLPSSELLLLNV